MNWEKSDLALKKLKQMLWGFEALRVFGDKLKKALDEVNRAESKMKTWLEKVSRSKSTPFGSAESETWDRTVLIPRVYRAKRTATRTWSAAPSRSRRSLRSATAG